MNNALVLLLNEKPFEYINVKDVCKVAKVSRSTFYLHYENTCDLLDETLGNLANSFGEHFKGKDRLDVKQAPTDSLFLLRDEYLIPYLNFVKENRNIFKTAKNHSQTLGFDELSKKLYANVIEKILERFGTDEKYKDYIFHFCLTGLNSLIYKWCEKGCDLSVEELSDLIKGLMPNVEKRK